ncbi:hypothetical protein CABS02_12473 [Colletotrichum abscissum]|uniref:Uncharacterized protein n=1 Tax=Colletotrichum abscissum TaxID=1671311 RepID=A0A9Q0AZD8_9PEZI|nr:hypothetical protein CABS02_12473 [Colletotrichum abscissum]
MAAPRNCIYFRRRRGYLLVAAALRRLDTDQRLLSERRVTVDLMLFSASALKSSPGNRCLSGGGQRLHRDSSGQSRSRSSRIPECGCSLVYRVAPFGFYTP